MIIDKNPIIDISNKKLTVNSLIDVSEPIWIMVNGKLTLDQDELLIDNNTITVLNDGGQINWYYDKISVMFN